MDFLTAYNSQIFALVILPLLIFLARVIDVTLGTIRIISVSRGNRILAPIVGFFEILIWLLAMGQIMQNLTNPIYYIAFAAGFAVGNFVGIYIEDKLAMGTSLIQVITQKDCNELVTCLHSTGYGVTTVQAQGAKGTVKIVYIVAKRKEVCDITKVIKRCNPKAFYYIEEVRTASREVYGAHPRQGFLRGLGLKRK